MPGIQISAHVRHQLMPPLRCVFLLLRDDEDFIGELDQGALVQIVLRCLSNHGAPELLASGVGEAATLPEVVHWGRQLPDTEVCCAVVCRDSAFSQDAVAACQSWCKVTLVLDLALRALLTADGFTVHEPPLAYWAAANVAVLQRFVDFGTGTHQSHDRAPLPFTICLVSDRKPGADVGAHYRSALRLPDAPVVRHYPPGAPDLCDRLLALPIRSSAVLLDPNAPREVVQAVRQVCLHCGFFCAVADGSKETETETAFFGALYDVFTAAKGFPPWPLSAEPSGRPFWAIPPHRDAPPGDPRDCVADFDDAAPAAHTANTIREKCLRPEGPVQKYLRAAQRSSDDDSKPVQESAWDAASSSGQPLCRMSTVLSDVVCRFDSAFAAHGAQAAAIALQESPLCTDLDRVVTAESSRRAYSASDAEAMHVVKGLHFGQRKLLLSEIEFLSRWFVDHPSTVNRTLCVYAGAADGRHLPCVFDLFPLVRWFLADPNKFHKAVDRSRFPQIVEVLNDLFLDETCLRIRRQFPDCAILLISDIRVGNPVHMAWGENTSQINADNRMQARWVHLLNARRAMLKFHPPYPDMTPDPDRAYINYFNGALHTGVWAPKSSTEVRLVVPAPAPVLAVPGLTDPTRPGITIDGGMQRALEEVDGRKPEATHGGVWQLEQQFTRTVGYHCKGFEQYMYHFNTNDRFTADCAAEARCDCEASLDRLSYPPGGHVQKRKCAEQPLFGRHRNCWQR